MSATEDGRPRVAVLRSDLASWFGTLEQAARETAGPLSVELAAMSGEVAYWRQQPLIAPATSGDPAPDAAVHDPRRPQLGDADLDMVLLSAIRYALGRATYIVGWTADLVAAQARWLAPGQRDVAIRDIEQALTEGRTGHEQDTVQWRRALNHLRAAGQPDRVGGHGG